MILLHRCFTNFHLLTFKVSIILYRVLLTGASGFVGSYLHRYMSFDEKFSVVATVRKLPVSTLNHSTDIVSVGTISSCTDWSAVLVGIDVIIHTAARAHIIRDEFVDQLLEYRRVNVDGTIALACQAVAAGVKRFIFISSIGVNGNINTAPFNETDVPAPAEPYAQSKHEAEIALLQLASETGLEVVIIRPPLVYGANAPGNFGSLVKAISKGLPLPLGAIHNKRSLVALDNLVDLIITCIDHPDAANQIFLAGDGEDISTTQLLRGVANAMGKSSRLIPIPASWLMMAATVLGKKAVAQRLLGSLQVDISKAQQLLGWTPPISVAEGLRRCFPTVKD